MGDALVLPGWVSPADLEGLYAAAACFVFPSLREGFGLPVLEAMRRGVPVACSNASAVPEVAGDAALTLRSAAVRRDRRRRDADPAATAALAEELTATWTRTSGRVHLEAHG